MTVDTLLTWSSLTNIPLTLKPLSWRDFMQSKSSSLSNLPLSSFSGTHLITWESRDIVFQADNHKAHHSFVSTIFIISSNWFTTRIFLTILQINFIKNKNHIFRYAICSCYPEVLSEMQSCRSCLRSVFSKMKQKATWTLLGAICRQTEKCISSWVHNVQCLMNMKAFS